MQKKEATSSRRPRIEDSAEQVLGAALELAYAGGVSNATVEKISAATGVAKTTIYRRWPNAGAIVMEAFLVEISPFIAYVEREDVVRSFAHAVTRLIKALEGRRGMLLRQLIGSAQMNDELSRAFWERWIQPRRQAAMEILQKAKIQGEIRPETNIDVLIDSIFGAVYYRIIIPYAPLTARYASELVAQVFSGVRAGTQK
jgi:AcrR family transcriptional regulator